MPPTLIYNTGWEHGVTSTSSAASKYLEGGGSGNSVVAGAARSGSYGMRLSATASSALWAQAAITGLTGVATGVVGRIYFRVNTAPAPGTITNVLRTEASGGKFLQVAYNSTLARLDVTYGVSSSFSTPTSSIATGVWYRIDFKADYSSASFIIISFALDGVVYASDLSGSGTTGSATHNAINLGWSGTNITMEIDFDDFAMSTTMADYPIGNGYSALLLPSSLAVATTGVFVQDATATAITTADWARLDDVPISETASYIRQTTGSSNISTGHPTLGFSNTVDRTINGVHCTIAYGAASTVGNNFRAWVTANSVDSYLHGSSSTQPTIGIIGPTYSHEQVLTGGAAWTDAMLDGTVFRWGTGAGTDVNPIPRLNNVILEVDYAVFSDALRHPTHRHVHILGR